MNTEKTASEWFDMLIEPYCTQAKEASKKFPNLDSRKGFYNSLDAALLNDFMWGYSVPLVDWNGIHTLIEGGDTTYLKPTEPQFGTWISVEDRLPNNMDLILIHLDNQMMVTGIYKLGEFDLDVDYYAKVTHWMPLPPNPTN